MKARHPGFAASSDWLSLLSPAPSIPGKKSSGTCPSPARTGMRNQSGMRRVGNVHVLPARIGQMIVILRSITPGVVASISNSSFTLLRRRDRRLGRDASRRVTISSSISAIIFLRTVLPTRTTRRRGARHVYIPLSIPVRRVLHPILCRWRGDFGWRRKGEVERVQEGGKADFFRHRSRRWDSKAIGQFGGGVEVRFTPHIGWINDFSWNVVDGTTTISVWSGLE